jgi:hypothetical protein
MKRTQRGMTLIGFIMVLAVVGILVYMGMKVIPMYSEYYSLKQALAGLAKQPNITDNEPAMIKDLLFRRLDISYANSIKPENVKIVRKDAGFVMTVDYESRKPLIAQLDVVGKFHAEQELRRRAVE